MNFLVTGWDWFVFGILTVSILWGLVRGLIHTIFGIASWLTAAVGAPIVAPTIVAGLGLHGHTWAVLALSFLVIFFSIRIVAALLAKGVKSAGLGMVDRTLGALLGLLRAGLIIVVVANAGHASGLAEQDAWRRAASRPLLDGCVSWFRPNLPDHSPASGRQT